MPELSVDNAAEWLSRHSLPVAGARFTELGGGISNKVILAEAPEFRAVLKQSLEQLRTKIGWHSDRGRIFREAGAMRWAAANNCTRIPRLLFEEPSTFTFAMEAAPAGAEMWKTRLFRGDLDSGIALCAGTALGSVIAASWLNTETARLFGDQTIFNQLRVDPYYRYTAQRLAEAAEYIDNLIKRSASRRVSIVHGDWSPKNLLVDGTGLWVIDWEVVHYGDPSFDIGFLLTHLLMKSVAMPQHERGLTELARAFEDGLWSTVPPEANWLVTAAMEHLPALLLARVYGKSPAEYLDSTMRQRVEKIARDMMRRPATSILDAFSR